MDVTPLALYTEQQQANGNRHGASHIVISDR